MKRIVRLSESDLARIIKRTIRENNDASKTRGYQINERSYRRMRRVNEGVIIGSSGGDSLNDSCLNTYFKAPGSKSSNPADFDQLWHVVSVTEGKSGDETTGWGASVIIKVDGNVTGEKCKSAGYNSRQNLTTNDGKTLKTGTLTLDCRKMDANGNIPLDYEGNNGVTGVRYNQSISEDYKEFCETKTTGTKGSGDDRRADAGSQNQGYGGNTTA